jgi:autotransporter-associated beta strand protein
VYGYGAIISYAATTNSWTANFTNNSTYTKVYVLIDCGFNLDGPMAGSGGLTETGTGTLTLSGTTANTYAGTTTMSGGTLLLDKPYATIAVPGPLVIGSNTTVRLLNGFQINNPATPVTMSDSSLFDLAGNSEWVGPISLQGAQITTEAGTLYLDGNITVNGSTVAQSVISGNAAIWDGTYTITSVGHNYSPDLLISANVTSGGGGGQGLIKDGAGEISLAGNNSFIGPVTINGGDVWAQTSTALGSSTNAPVTVNTGGTLFLAGTGLDFGLKPLVLNGIGYAFGALLCDGSSTWEGGVTLGSDSTIYTRSGSSFTLAGAVSGVGGIIEAGPGTLTFGGSTANTYAGLTTVSAGTLLLNKSGVFDGAIPGNLVIGGTVRLNNVNQIANTSEVTINGGGLLDLNTFYDGIGTISGTGTLALGTQFLDMYGTTTYTFDGIISGLGFFRNNATGTAILNGNNTYAGATIAQSGGTIIVNGSQPQSPVTVAAGATLGGSGTVGTIAANGIISPGTSPVILNSSNVIFSSTGNFTVELTGPNAGVAGYDRLNVTGTVSLANATLNVIPNFTTPVSIGQQFIIINNNGAAAITGIFNGLPTGTLFSVGGYAFRISYAGGTGNDVVLTLLGVPGNTVTVNAVDEGWYNSAGSFDTGNYAAGEDSSAANTNIYRNWFVFDVPVFSGSIIHAELLINTYDNSSPNGQETYLLRKVTTPVATLEAGGSGLVGIYDDLGTNAVYSIRSVATNESAMRAIIPLNVQFFNDAAAASGGQMALGGSIVTLNPTNTHNQYLFGYSEAVPGDIQLRLTFGTSVVINSADRGWYNNLGNHTADNLNYLVGEDTPGDTNFFRNFFVFNLPALSGQLVNAQLLLNSYSNASPSGFETYQLYDITNSITVLTNTASGATNVYADLGSGVNYGGRNVYVSESGLIASIPLNGSFLSAAQANSGGPIALGGSLTSLDPISHNNKCLFSFSNFSTATDAQLWLGFLNAPSSHPSFVAGTPTYLEQANGFVFVVSGTTGTTNEIQGSFDFQNWDFLGDLVMTSSTNSFGYTNNAVVPYRFFRLEQLQ